MNSHFSLLPLCFHFQKHILNTSTSHPHCCYHLGPDHYQLSPPSLPPCLYPWPWQAVLKAAARSPPLLKTSQWLPILPSECRSPARTSRPGMSGPRPSFPYGDPLGHRRHCDCSSIMPGMLLRQASAPAGPAAGPPLIPRGFPLLSLSLVSLDTPSVIPPPPHTIPHPPSPLFLFLFSTSLAFLF